MRHKSRGMFFHWLFLGLVGFILYLPALKQYFYGDDFLMLGWFRQPMSIIQALSFEIHLGYEFRPITDLLLWACFRLFGWNPLPYYLVNIILHWGATILTYLLAYKLTQKISLAFIAGLIFITAFSHQEVVTWIIGNHLILQTCTYLGVLLCYFEARSSRRMIWDGLAVLLFALSLLISQYSITILPALVLMDYYMFKQDGGWFKPLASRMIPYLVILVPYIWVQYSFIQKGTSEAVSQGAGGYHPGLHMLVALTRLGFLFFGNPYQINFFPRLTEIVSSSQYLSGAIQIYRFILEAGWLVFSIIVWMKGGRIARFLILWIFLTFLPYTPWTIPTLWDASRYLYLPSIGFSILLAICIYRAAQVLALHIHKTSRFVAGSLVTAWILINAAGLYPLEIQLVRSGEVRRDVIQQIQTLQPQFPNGAQVMVVIPHNIYADLATAIPQFYSSSISATTLIPAEKPAALAPNEYLFEYRSGKLDRVNLPIQ